VQHHYLQVFVHQAHEVLASLLLLLLVDLAFGVLLQVSCMAASTGRALWQLPTKYPSKVVALNVQQYQQQQQQERAQHRFWRPQQQQQLVQLLYVLNARSQLICWQVPGSSSSSSSSQAAQQQLQLPTCKQCTARLLRITDTSRKAPTRTELGSKDAGRQAGKAVGAGSPPASQSTAVLPTANAPVVATGGGNSSSSNSSQKPPAVCELPVQPETGLLANLTSQHAKGCSSLACPEFGNSCLFVGSGDGYLSVAELMHVSSSNSSSTGNGQSSDSHGQGSSSSSQEAEGAAGLPQQQQQQQLGNAGDSGGASATAAAAAAAGEAAGEQHIMVDCVDGRSSSRASGSTGCALQLQLARRCSLTKLAKLVGQRAAQSAFALTAAAPKGGAGGHAAAVGVPGGSSSSSRSAAAGLRRTADTDEKATSSKAPAAAAAADGVGQTADAAGVRCTVFTDSGRLAVGLASGHVCLLRFRGSS
jgi:hypothetical protein